MDDRDLGVLAPDGKQWALTFTRRLGHPVEKVWRAVTEPQHRDTWFPHRIVGELRAGAPVRFVTSDNPEDGFAGEVRACEPPKLLELMWGTDLLRIELVPDGDGTLLTLTDRFAELGKAARDAAGWHECLERMAAELDGADPGEWGDHWRAVHPLYVERFGPDAATIGPPDEQA